MDQKLENLCEPGITLDNPLDHSSAGIPIKSFDYVWGHLENMKTFFITRHKHHSSYFEIISELWVNDLWSLGEIQITYLEIFSTSLG